MELIKHRVAHYWSHRAEGFETSREKLQRQMRAVGVLHLVHRPHSAMPQHAHDAVWPDFLWCGQTHIDSSAICSARTSSVPLNWNTIWWSVVPRAREGTDLSAIV